MSMPPDPRVPLDRVWVWLSEVMDPEIPIVSVVDLGIVRDVQWNERSDPRTDEPVLVVTVTPTYSGCPATEVIGDAIRAALAAHGIDNVRLQRQLSPAWTTDWLSEAGRNRLRDYGIAPPACTMSAAHARMGTASVHEQTIDASRILQRVKCPRCGSGNTRLASQFGSTPCKALYVCGDCREPFDYFKPH